MRRDECRTIRVDVIDQYPDGVPSWMIPLPVDQCLEAMRLRELGFSLVGLEPGDDPGDLFEDEL